MYSRARRVTDLCSKGASSGTVGPASYNIQRSAAVTTESFAPFLSLSSRTSVFDMNNEQCSPGPAHYNGVLTWVPSSGVHSMQSRSRRFEESQSDIPGPGTYNIIQPWGKNRHRPSSQERGIKYLRTVFHSAPSIPTPSQAFGYEENENRELRRQTPPRTDESLGPAYYSPTQVEPKYKGIHFGQMTGKRTEIKVTEGPGPGHYHPEEDHSVCYENVNLKQELSVAELQLPRYPELLVLQENKKAVPGPGQYDLKGQFEKSVEVTKSSAAFMSHTPRFASVKDVTPPVGSYSDPRSALGSLKKHSGIKRSPFNLTAARFIPENRNTTPGPGAYNVVDGLVNENLKKAQLEGKRAVGFGSTAARTTILISKTTVPGPAHYTVKNKQVEVNTHPSAVFKSAVQRLPALCGVQDTPSPSSYKLQDTWDKVLGQHGCREPHAKAATKPHSFFLSTAPRISLFHSDHQIPGPGHYSPDIRSSPQFALITSTEARFKQPENMTPAPGAHTLSPTFSDTLLKQSFNLTLRTPMMSQTPARPPLLANDSALTFTAASIKAGSKVNVLD